MDDWTKILGIGGAGGGIGFLVAMLIRSAMQRGEAVDKRYDTLITALTLRVTAAEHGHDDCLKHVTENGKRITAIEALHEECLERAANLDKELLTLKAKVNVIEQASSKY